jgi:integrase
MYDSLLPLLTLILGLLALFDRNDRSKFAHAHLAALKAQREPVERTVPVLYFFAKRKGSTGKAVNRSGTIRQLGPDHWQVRADLPRGLDGKRRRKSLNIHGTKLDAEGALLELQQCISKSSGSDKPQTVGELLDRWLAREVEPTVRRATYLDYKRKADTYVRPYLKDISLEKLDLTTVEAFRNELLKRPRRIRSKKIAKGPKAQVKKAKVQTIADATVKAGLKTLSMALNYAVRLQVLPYNEVSNLKRSRWKKNKNKPKKKSLTEAQLASFLEAARGDYWYPLFALLATTGMRPSEALGLQWSHIDWDKKWISIEQKLTLHPDGTYEFDDPKTENSEREVPLSPGLDKLLTWHSARQEELRTYDPEIDLVFPDLDGLPADSRNILRHHVKPIARKAGIDRNVTLYSFRYTFMTLSTGSTRLPKKTSRVLGHGTASFSDDVYNDPDQEELRESTDVMDGFLPPHESAEPEDDREKDNDE